MGAWYEPGRDLSGLLVSIIDAYAEERDHYLSVDDPKVARIVRLVDEVARAIVESSDEFVLNWQEDRSTPDWETTRALIRTLELSREVREKTEILLASRFAENTDQMSDRCIQLAELLLERPPSEKVLRFLRRLGRCYIAGFFPESIIVCRGVLENSVNEELDRRKIATDGKMGSKLDALQNCGAISAGSKKNAFTVWRRGNTAAHNDPSAVGNAFETIVFTFDILQELQ